MLLPRLLTGVLGGALLLGVIYTGGLPFFLVILGLSLVALREFYDLSKDTGYATVANVGLFGGFLLTTSVFLNGMGWGSITDNQGSAFLLAIFILILVLYGLLRGPADIRLSEWSVTLFGILFVNGSLAHLLLMRDLHPFGMAITFMLFAMIWAADTFAYIIGMRWGKHKLAPKISPKKSWEGFIAGTLGAVLCALIFRQFYFKFILSLPEACLLAVVIAAIALASDLAESMVKRGANAKDSSHILPGHGGLLDRFDSFLLAAPFYYYYWAFFKHG
jgi:phosphatidate cytidylyltransferase